MPIMTTESIISSNAEHVCVSITISERTILAEQTYLEQTCRIVAESVPR